MISFKDFLDKDTFDEWFIKRFGMVLDENFKSDNAIFFSTDVTDSYTRGNDVKKQMLFYEKLGETKFNLYSYLMTFGNKQAAQAMNSPLPQLTRGLVYFVGAGFLIFIWKSGIAHQDVAKALSSIKTARKLPDIDYLGLYNITYKIGKRGKLGEHWCFPVVMLNGQLITNVTEEALYALLSQKKINEVFGFTDQQTKDLVKKVKE